MLKIPNGSVDMVLADPPYGTTACRWDSVIPLEDMWRQLRRVIKPTGAIVMMASQPFTTNLIGSNLKRFAYCYYWNKGRVTGFANAKRQPLRKIEEVVVFYRKPPTYNPQGLVRVDRKRKNSKSVGGETLRGNVEESKGKGTLRTAASAYVQEFTNYPTQVLEISSYEKNKVHPTQKPVALMEYLIQTYTNVGELVLDFAMGSGTTGVACLKTGREFIGIESDPAYYEIATGRIGL